MDSSMEANLQATEWDRDTLMKARWLVGCQEAKFGKVHKSLIRQVWIPDEWLAEEEPENPPRHGKDSTKELRSSRGTGQAPAQDKGLTPPVSKAPQVMPQPPPAPTAKTAEGANGSNSGPKDPKARVKAGDENESHGTKHSDGSTGISSPFDTSSNSSKESSPVELANGCSGSSSRNVINISSCITSDRGKTISLDASITHKRRVPTAEEEATAALSAMLGLGKPKAPQKPTPPPPRTHVPWSSESSSSYAPEKPRKGLNPNAAEFHPCMWSSYDCEYEYDFVPPPPPPLEGDEAPETELPEMSNLLGVNLLDEICGGAAVPQAGQRMDDDEADA